MFKFTRAGMIKLFLILVLICSTQIFIYHKTQKIDTELNTEIMKNVEKVIPEQMKTTEEKSNVWEIEISKIGLKAEIAEGTTQEVLNKKIGHFKETPRIEGNIGLAAHNRGYDVNYFAKLKLLQEGDEIKYQYNQYINRYEVIKNIIIKDTDWSYLENTDKNILTLITCIENEPSYRRCVQAIKKEETY